MKKGLLIVCLIGSAFLAFGGPPGGAPPRHGGPGPRHHRHGGDGVRLAADITAIVANSLGILNELAAPRSYCVAPAAPCVTTPVYVQPRYRSTGLRSTACRAVAPPLRRRRGGITLRRAGSRRDARADPDSREMRCAAPGIHRE